MIDLLRPWVLALLPLPFLAWRLLPALAANAALPVPLPIRNLIVALSDQGQRRQVGPTLSFPEEEALTCANVS